MEPTLVARFEELRPAIKARWSERLREAPSGPSMASGLVTPAMLVLMLDDTLGLTLTQLKTRQPLEPSKRDLTAFNAMERGCRCGLHLLLNYYLVGANALREVLPKSLGKGRVAILHHFNQLAHDEMSALCGVCLHREATLCSLEEKGKNFAPGDAR